VVTGTEVGEAFQAEVVGLDEAGSGIVELAAGNQLLRVHVAGALPGEPIQGRITYRSVHASAGQRDAWAILERVDRLSPDRALPVCPAHGRCGGCSLMHAGYHAQLEWKRSRVRDEFARHPALAAVEVAACVPSPATVGYRNQAKYVYARAKDGALVLGAYAPRSHDVVDLAGCQVVEPVLDQTRQAVLGILSAHDVEPFHEVRRTGLLRYLMLRSNRAHRVLATLIVARADWPLAGAVAAACMQQCPALVGVVLNVNGGTGNVLFGEEERLLAGQSTLEDEIGEVQVRLASRSFFQANRAVGSRIYRDLVALLRGHLERAVDAYSGAGGIALSLLSRVQQVVAIENNPAATEAGSGFASDRLRVVTADAAEGLAAVDAADLIVLNPPRKGCSGAVLAQVRRLSPGLIAYLSCDPQSLARDLSVLVKAGATVTSAVPYDMMPHTPHVETLVLLSSRA
jgi:23S rRNA (uracil1939-C5)-methyltransferase